MATYLADMVIVFDGEPGIKTTASAPMSLLIGMNKFLESLEITFRRDPDNFRPRYSVKNFQVYLFAKFRKNYIENSRKFLLKIFIKK